MGELHTGNGQDEPDSRGGHMKNFRKVLSKTFEKVLSNEGYAKHTPTLRKPKFRFSNDGYGAPYPDTPSRGVNREEVCAIPLYVIKGHNPL